MCEASMNEHDCLCFLYVKMSQRGENHFHRLLRNLSKTSKTYNQDHCWLQSTQITFYGDKLWNASTQLFTFSNKKSIAIKI